MTFMENRGSLYEFSATTFHLKDFNPLIHENLHNNWFKSFWHHSCQSESISAIASDATTVLETMRLFVPTKQIETHDTWGTIVVIKKKNLPLLQWKLSRRCGDVFEEEWRDMCSVNMTSMVSSSDLYRIQVHTFY